MKHLITAILIFLTMGLMSPAQNFTLVLGRPTDHSVTVNAVFTQTSEVYWEYGTETGSYPSHTPTYTAKPDSGVTAEIGGLNPDKRYFYRTRYRPTGQGTFLQGAEYRFSTARPAGRSFVFAIEADPHLDTNSNPAAYSLTLQNILNSGSDFMLDLGDNFMSEKQPGVNQSIITARHLLYRPYFGSVCHSVPLYIVIGNHEGENGWVLTGSADCLPVMASNTRNRYYANPVPDGFYSGNSKPENFVGLRGNYYAWEWGDALFVVLDPYWYTNVKNGWGWTLGADQYEWFKNVLESSSSKFKFVFCHQLLGGKGTDARGGAEYARFFEQGGSNSDSTYGFDANRPGWGVSIHQLMVDHHVNVFFHGHDHCYARQDKDELIYQEVPQPSSRNIDVFTGTPYGYTQGTLLPSRGFLKVTVTDTAARVEYIRTFLSSEEKGGHLNGEVADAYTLRPFISGTGKNNDTERHGTELKVSPNPFTEGARVSYRLPSPDHVRLEVLDMTGRVVAILADGEQEAGIHEYPYLLRMQSPGAGLYYCRLTTSRANSVIKMIQLQSH